MSEEESTTGSAIFGSFDGLTSVLGIIVALLGSPLHVLLAGAAGLAASSAVGMGAGQYLGDADRSVRRALAMALSTIIGTIIPVVPFLFLPRVAAVVVASVLVIVFGVLVAKKRGGDRRSYLETFGVLMLAAAVAIVVALATGAA